MFRILAFILCLFATHEAMADIPPLPQRKTADLQTIQKQITEEKKNKEQIEKNLKTAEQDLHKAKENLVKTAESIRSQENMLRMLQQRIDKNTQESIALKSNLQKDYGSISELILMLVRLRQVPAEAMLVRPSAPLETAQSAMLLANMLEGINARTVLLSETLDKLYALQQDLKGDQTQALESRAALESKYSEIASLTKKREELYKKLNKDYGASIATVQKLAAESQNLQDFMTRLQDDSSQEQYKTEQKVSRSPVHHSAVTIGKGTPRMPVSGTATVSFGQKDKIGAESKGITIEGEPRGMVVSPMGGIVRFSGDFKDYGPVVIIEHKDQYHSLIIGLDKISVMTGQQLEAGEPVGRLPTASSRGGSPALYYELRHKGHPVNPAARFTESKS